MEKIVYLVTEYARYEEDEEDLQPTRVYATQKAATAALKEMVGKRHKEMLKQIMESEEMYSPAEKRALAEQGISETWDANGALRMTTVGGFYGGIMKALPVLE